MQVPFFSHDLGQPELDAVAEVLRGPVLTTGDAVAAFERRFAEYLGRRHAVATTSCTGALQLSLTALGIGPGDEVITTPMTFVATSLAIAMAGARPVFVDVEPDTANLDAAQIEAAMTPRTRAVMPVHMYGQMCDMRAIRDIADRHGLAIVEDAAHCVEGSRDGVRPGQLGAAACFSFYATKSLTCGEGGAVVTDDDALAAKLRLLRLHGMTKMAADRMREGYTHWDVLLMGWKYNMDNIQAALLLPQIDRLERARLRREELDRRYRDGLAGLRGVGIPAERPDVRHARHLFTVWIEDGRRDRTVDALQKAGVGVVVNYRPVHLLSWPREAWGHRPGDFPRAERIGDETISLPLYPRLRRDQQDYVIETLRRAAADA